MVAVGLISAVALGLAFGVGVADGFSVAVGLGVEPGVGLSFGVGVAVAAGRGVGAPVPCGVQAPISRTTRKTKASPGAGVCADRPLTAGLPTRCGLDGARGACQDVGLFMDKLPPRRSP